ncbi:hypothetical protein [Deinococcus radiotolerans]|uniref:hypothetical protein n=1 Tax=Deinococcus radiotolerans TaxID=1309407 RepID=UPI0016661564|nr:hypothetical protein [Deinococcus radiotolerans]
MSGAALDFVLVRSLAAGQWTLLSTVVAACTGALSPHAPRAGRVKAAPHPGGQPAALG